MIDCQGLTKQYGQLRAVDDLTFRVEPGEVLGFLGPNGAGKTTTMRIVAGFLPATDGRVTVSGFDVEAQATEAKRRIGYLPEGAPSYPEMTPRSFLEFIASAREVAPQKRKARLDEVFQLLHLEKVLDQTIDTLSKGYKRRVALAQAIVHDPEVLILDEPTDGLDPNQKHEVRELIGRMAKSKIIVISTHLLEEVEAVCNRAIIIAHGKILADDTPQRVLRARTASRRSRRASSTRSLPLDHGRSRGRMNRRSSAPRSLKRELASYFATPVAYVFIVIFLILASAFTFYIGNFYERGQADLTSFFTFHPWLFLFLVPALSMRLWAEERKSGSIELLMTLPIEVWQAVLGKFLAAWLFTGIAIALTFPIWITVNYLGQPDNGVIFAAYVGSFLMAGGFLAVGVLHLGDDEESSDRVHPFGRHLLPAAARGLRSRAELLLGLDAAGAARRDRVA